MARHPRPRNDSGRPPTARRARVEELEARVLLSADAPWAVLDAALVDATHESLESVEPRSARDADSTQSEQHVGSRELVFVDAGIDDYETLVEDLLARDPDTTRTIEVVVLESDRDGISQISEALAGRSDLDAVHVVSHGSDEGIQLGGTWLTGSTLGAYADSVAGWRDGLSEDADLLLYGCNLASSADGKALIEQLASLTGADVAASIDATGAALLGGDWELEHATGSMESGVAVSAQAQATFGGVLDGSAIWTEKGSSIPSVSEFDTSTFGASGPTASVAGEWRVIAGAEAPTRDEKIVVGANDSGQLRVLVWDGSSWTANRPAGMGSVSDAELWGFDVAYESQSGDAVIVWSNGANALETSVWDGATWSPTVTVTPPVSDEPVQMKLAANPNTDEMMLIVSNTRNEVYTHRWDGNAWDSGKHFPLGDSSVDVTDVAVAYEQLSGDAMIVFGGSGENVHYRVWDGLGWSGAGIADPSGPGSQARWTTLASDPNSDRIVVGVETDFNTAWLAVWDGSAWEPSVLASNNTLHSDRQNLAVAFESTSGEAIAAYTRLNQLEVRYQRWAAGGGWSGELIGPALSSHPDALTLDADPISDTLMLSVVEDNRQVSFSAWDGDAWGTPQVLGADAGINRSQPFLFLWDQGSAIANMLPTADASAGTPHVISEGGPLSLDGSASSDPGGSITSWAWDIGNDGSFEKTGVTTGYSWAELIAAGVDDDGSYDVALRVTDDGGATNTQVFALTVDNTAPTLMATGPPSVQAGVLYTLNLSAVDPGDDTIAGWTINWGDGTINTVGDVNSLTHTYTQAGFTRNITVSASDEDGTYLYGDAFLTSNVTDSLFRFDATTGALPREFADLDGLGNPVDVEIGPDGLIYATGFSSGDIRRYDATTSAFVDQFVTGLSAPPRMAFGPDGDLYVTDSATDEVLRFDGSTGAPQGAFVTAGSGTLDFPDGIAFAPDGNLYVASSNNLKVLRYDGGTGAFIDEFASGIPGFSDLKFGPDGNLYVSSTFLNTVQRLDGTTGVKIDDFVTAGSGGMLAVAGFDWGPDGELYVVDFFADRVLRYDGSDGSFIDEYIPSSGPIAPINITFTPAQQVLVTATPNTAPVLNPAGPSLTSISEDDTANAGDLVSSIVGGSITDADALAVEGIAITSLTSSNGTWEYSLDGGAIWNAVPLTVSETTALLLRDSDRVRFVPDGENADAASFDFRAWDQTTGTTGSQVDVNDNGGTTAFSTDFDTASILVSGVNDVPVLDTTVTPVLDDVLENAGPPDLAVGTLISDLVGLVGSGGLDNVSDVDDGAVTGIAVAGADETNGKWHYTIDGGTTWLPLGSVNPNSARLLAAEPGTRIYFEPDPGFSGTIVGAIRIKAWDQSSSGVNGDLEDTVPWQKEGAFSQSADLVDITVIDVNDAPTIANTTGGQTVTDTTTVDPFGSVTIGDLDLPAQTLSVDIQLDDAAKGALINLGGFTNLGGGLYRFTGTAAAATTAIQGLTFDPAENRVVPGATETTTFTISVDDGVVVTPVVDAATTVISTSVNDAPTLAGTVAGQPVTDVTTVDPFSGVTIGDVDTPAQTLTVDVQLDAAAKGVLTNLGGFSDLGGGLYRFTGTAANATTAIRGLTFDPADNRVAPGSTETTTFTLSVGDGVAAPVVDATTTVIATSVNDAPTLVGTLAGQPVTDVTTVDPFSGVTIGDVDTPAQTLTVDVQLDAAAKGVLTNLAGFSDLGGGLYRFTGTAANATTAIRGLTFDPADNRVAPGSTETTTFTLSVGDGVAAPVVDATTTVIATSVNDAPTLVGTLAGQPVTDVTTVDPFSGVTIGDVDNPAQTLTVDVQLDTAAKGVLTNLGGFSDLGGGLYRFTGTATAATTAIRGLTFDPADNRVAPGSTETTTFTLSVGDGVAAPVVDATTTVIATSVNDAPTLVGTLAGQPVTDVTTVDPFSGVTIGDVDTPTQTLTVDVQLDAAAKGVLTNLAGFSDLGGGLYRFTGTAANATTAIRGLTFDPTDDRVTPGSSETTTFTVRVDDGVATPVVDATTTVISMSQNDAPTLAGTVAGQPVTDVTTVDPFSGVTIGDVDNPAQTLTVDVQLDTAAKGVLTNLAGFSDLGGGLYRFTGTAANATTAIRGLTFDPTDDRVTPGSSETTTFTVRVDDGVATPVVDATTTVISMSQNDAPTLAGTLAGQPVTDVTTVDPFSGVTIGDVDNPAQTLTVDVQLDTAAKGVLTNLGGFSDLGGGLYRFTGTATAATTAIRGLTFDPADNRVAPGSTETTTFTLSVGDGVAAPVVDATTTVIATSVNDAPTLVGTLAGQPVTDVTTVDPFSGVTIGDVDTPAQTLTVDVQLDAAAKGVLTNLAGFSDLGGGLYRFTGTATAATTAIRGLTFDPTENRVTPGSSETTTFTVTVDDGVATPVVDATTTVISTSINDAPVLDAAGDMTLSDVSESDPDPGGDSVAAIIASAGGDRITDVDSGAAEGIAVVSVDDSNGSWQYSTDGGVIWTAFGSVSDTSAVLLDAGARVRFVPSPAYTGSSGDILFHAWDQSTGSNGQVGVNASLTGGTTAFSVADETATADVTALNFAPVLTPSGPALPTISEDDVDNRGERVSAIVAGSIVDANSSALEGIAITRLASGNGNWQYSLDGGASWNALPATSDSAALLLRDSDWIRFVPDAQNADAASFDFRAWDQTSGSAGTRVDVATNGGQTAFSTAVDTASITATGLNDAPSLGSAVLSPVLEDDPNPPGATIATLFGGSFSDVDAGSGFAGLAVIANAADPATQGVWQYSSDGGANWFAVGGVGDDASAIALASTSQLRFVSVSPYQGNPSALIVRGLDDTYGGGFSSTAGGSETRANVDASTNGGESELSGTSAALTTSVFPGNIALDLSGEEDPLPEEDLPPEIAPEEPAEAPEEAPEELEQPVPLLPDDPGDVSNDRTPPSEVGPSPLLRPDPRDFAAHRTPDTALAAQTNDDTDRREESSARTALAALSDLFQGRSLIDGEALANLIFGGERGEFMRALDSIQLDHELLTGFEARVARSAIAATTGLSVGYVLWLTRGGLLVASLLSSLPAWRLIDPIPILASLELGDDERRNDDESLDSLVRGDADKSDGRTVDEKQRAGWEEDEGESWES